MFVQNVRRRNFNVLWSDRDSVTMVGTSSLCILHVPVNPGFLQYDRAEPEMTSTNWTTAQWVDPSDSYLYGLKPLPKKVKAVFLGGVGQAQFQSSTLAISGGHLKCASSRAVPATVTRCFPGGPGSLVYCQSPYKQTDSLCVVEGLYQP